MNQGIDSSAVTRPAWPTRRSYFASSLQIRDRTFTWGERTYLMGIINVSPDSFSGDGLRGNAEEVARQAVAFEAAGADILDIGAESTRPEAEPLAPGEELRRLLPALEAVRAATELSISIDTYRAGVAERAFFGGADMVNDISGLLADPEMAPVVSEYRMPVVTMHNQRDHPHRDVAGDIAAGFEASLGLADRARISRSRIILDAGFGFGWAAHQNFEMIRRLPELFGFNLPLMLGPSRKSSLGALLDEPADRRMQGTASSVALSIAAGADIVRVHDVAEMRQVALIADAVTRDNWRDNG